MHRYYLAAAVMCAIIGSFLIHGQHQYQKGYQAAQTESQLRFAEQEKKHRENVQQISQAFQNQQAQLSENERKQNSKLDKIIAQNTVYLNRCFDDHGLRELKNAITGNAN